MIDSKIINELIRALKQPERKTRAYDTIAEVVRIEDGIAWVHIPGGVDETPVQMSINSKVGDTVRVRVSGGQAWLMGNDTSPPTDDEKAEAAKSVADKALMKIDKLEAIQIIAEMIETNSLTVLGDLDGTGYRVVIQNDGLYIVDPDDEILSKYGTEAYIGKESVGVTISGSSISMESHGENLFSVTQIENATVLGKKSGYTFGATLLPNRSNTMTDENIVINATHPLRAKIKEVINGTSMYAGEEVYTEYTFTSTGSYAMSGQFGTTFYFNITDTGFGYNNPSQVSQSVNTELREYYVSAYSGEFAFGNSFAIDSSGQTKIGFIPFANFEPDASLTTVLGKLGWLSYVTD